MLGVVRIDLLQADFAVRPYLEQFAIFHIAPAAGSVSRYFAFINLFGFESSKSGALHVGFRLGADSSRWQGTRHVKAGHADSVIGHAVINVESVRRTQIIAAVDAGGEHDVDNGTDAFLRKHRRQYWLRRTISRVDLLSANVPSRSKTTSFFKGL